MILRLAISDAARCFFLAREKPSSCKYQPCITKNYGRHVWHVTWVRAASTWTDKACDIRVYSHKNNNNNNNNVIKDSMLSPKRTQWASTTTHRLENADKHKQNQTMSLLNWAENWLWRAANDSGTGVIGAHGKHPSFSCRSVCTTLVLAVIAAQPLGHLVHIDGWRLNIKL